MRRPAGRRGVDVGTFAGENPQADRALVEIFDDLDEVFEASGKIRAIIFYH